MTEQLETSFYILGDIIDDDIYRQIMNSLHKIDGIISLTHPLGTNTIDVSAEWDESEFDKKIEEIRKISNVKNLVINTKNKFIKRSLKEIVKNSESVSWIIEKDTIGEIDRAKHERNYFMAISYPCTVFEYYGKQVLLWHLKGSGTPVNKERLDRMTLEAIIIMLFTHKLIDEATCIKIFEVKDLRNKFIHKGRSIKFSSDHAQEAEKAIVKAVDCVKSIKMKYDSMIG